MRPLNDEGKVKEELQGPELEVLNSKGLVAVTMISVTALVALKL